jgi:hypothetical protein
MRTCPAPIGNRTGGPATTDPRNSKPPPWLGRCNSGGTERSDINFSERQEAASDAFASGISSLTSRTHHALQKTVDKGAETSGVRVPRGDHWPTIRQGS